MAGRSRKYPLKLRQRAVRMVTEIRGDHESEWAVEDHLQFMADFATRLEGANLANR